MPVNLVQDILRSLDRDVLNQLDLARSIGHPGENGRAREQVIADYLRRTIPADLGISTGFVFDAKGHVSKQIDIVIYRTSHHPILEIGGVKHFMVESVVAVIENKASIATTQALRAAFENIRSVKTLDRTNGGENVLLGNPLFRTKANPDEHQHQIFGAVVTEESLTQDAVKTAWIDFLQECPSRREWPNLYVDVRHFSGAYLKRGEPPTATTVAGDADCLYLTDPRATDRVPPLLEMTFELLNFIPVAATIDFSPTAYLFSKSGPFHWWRLPQTPTPQPPGDAV